MLVVDDHPTARTGICEILKAEGFATIDCASGHEALSILRREPRVPIAVALLDLHLPDLDGIRLLKHVRRDRTDVPVIIYTGEGSQESARHALDLGAWGYLEKGEDPRHLVATVRAAFVSNTSPSARRQAGKRRHKPETTLNRITDAIPGAVYRYLLRPSGEQRFLYVSRGIEELLGLTPEETQRDFARVWRLGHPDDADSLLQSIQESARTLKPWYREFRVIIGGRTKWLRGSSIPEPPYPDGSIAWNGILVDITEQHLAENALRFARFATDRAADCIYWMTPDAKFFYVNDAACQSLGYSRDELLSMSVHDIDPEYPAEAWPAFWERLRVEGSITLESRLRRNGGEVFPVEIKTNYLKFEGKEFNCSIVRDLTQRRQAEAKLLSSERRYRTLVESSPYCIHVLDLSGNFLSMNQAGLRMLGIASEIELTGKSYLDTVSDTDKERIRQLFATALKGELCEFEFTCVNGCIFQSSFVPMIDPEGKVSSIMGLTLDVSERRRSELALSEAQTCLLRQREVEKRTIEEELDKARATLVRQTRLAALGQLLGSMAHELRNPLAMIRNAAYLLKRRLPPSDEIAAEYLNMIECEVDLSNRVIQDLQALSRCGTPEKQTLEVGRQIGEAKARARVPATVTCRVEMHPDPFEIYADPGQLQQILVNLMSNACQAMRHRGDLTVRARRAGRWDILTISDNGPGIPDKHRRDIFEPLFTTKLHGFGLGLTICRHIVDQHDGFIDLLDPPRGGAAFEIRLPAGPMSP